MTYERVEGLSLRTALACCTTLLSIVGAGQAAGAGPADSASRSSEVDVRAPAALGWRAERSLSLAARSDWTQTVGEATSFASLAVTGQLRLSAAARPYSAGLLVECSVAQDRGDSAIIAGVASYSAPRWTVLFAPFFKKTAGGPGQWKHQSTLRYRLSPRHSVGVELSGFLTDPARGKFMLGYYGRLSKSVSVTATIGTGMRGGPDRAARVSMLWRVW